MKNIPAKLAPPRYSDPEISRRAELLNVLSLFLFVVMGSLIILNYIQSGNLVNQVNLILIILLIFQVVTQILIRTGYVYWAGLILLLISWVGITWFAARSDGVRDAAVLAYVTILIGAGYMYGWRAVMLFASWSILAIWLLAFYEINGLMQFTQTNPGRVALYLTALIILVSFQVYYVMNTLKTALSESTSELRARHQAEEKYRNIVENAVYGIFQSSPDGHFLSVNTAMARIYGYETPEELLQNISDIASQLYVDAADRAEFMKMLQADGAARGFEARNRKKDGSIIWVSSHARAVKDEHDRILYYEGTVEDISERKTANAEREQLLSELGAKNAELERFVYTVSHDLKSPLVTIVGFLGYVEEDLKTGDLDALHRDMDRIYRATFRMQDLLQDLLELSRIGRVVSEPVPVSFGALVDEAVELTEGRLHERGVQVRIQPNLPTVYGDAKRLLELVQNLIDNAAKYVGEQSHPLIEIGQDGFENGMPVLFVRDNGMGIAPEHHERIFGLFNKLNPNMEGTGVGLALVKRIVEFHGGRIWVESEVGQGATFRFSLPASENSSDTGSPKSNK